MKKHWVHFQVNSYYCTEFLETQAKGTLFGVAQDPPELLTYQNSNQKWRGNRLGSTYGSGWPGWHHLSKITIYKHSLKYTTRFKLTSSYTTKWAKLDISLIPSSSLHPKSRPETPESLLCTKRNGEALCLSIRSWALPNTRGKPKKTKTKQQALILNILELD